MTYFNPQPKPLVWKSPKYRRYVASKRCAVPGCFNKSNFHHEDLGIPSGMGTKCPDSQGLNICPEHHTILHRLGPKRFYKLHDMEPKKLITKNICEYIEKDNVDAEMLIINLLTEYLSKGV